LTEFLSSVGPKGQLTIPYEVRKELGIKPKDKVAVQVEKDHLTIIPARSQLDAIYQFVPSLKPPRTWEEVTELAGEEHAQHVATEGLAHR